MISTDIKAENLIPRGSPPYICNIYGHYIYIYNVWGLFPPLEIACCNCSYKTIQRALDLGYLYIPKELIEFYKNNQNLSAHQILMENYSFPYNAIVKNKMLNIESPFSKPRLKKIYNSGLTASKGDNKIKCIVC